jgi:hypothetical protein
MMNRGHGVKHRPDRKNSVNRLIGCVITEVISPLLNSQGEATSMGELKEELKK